MPHLVAIELTAPQRRSRIEEILREFESEGYEKAGRLEEPGSWSELFALASTQGLFRDKLLYIVDEAEKLGPFPERLEALLEKEGARNVIILLYNGKCNAFPKSLKEKVRIVTVGRELKNKRERLQWMEEVAQRKGLSLTGEALSLLDEWIEDIEEIESEIEKFCLAEQKSVTAELVRELSKDEGSRVLFRLLDGVCLRDGKAVLSSLKKLQGKAELLVVVASLYKRLRLASLFLSFGGRGLDAAGARYYQSKMAKEAARRYTKEAIWNATVSLGLLSAAEKMGRGKGWLGLELVLCDLIRTQPPLSC
ncbi:DNA polymerase III subunit delta [Acetomicrobium hydrogeniformans]|uniref:DNA polymerase III subunit delta n=1 Tax=Acetomicrobium hydrogeniformans TaxID=649746 RepID=A0A7V6ZFN0_9BACT|nr:DNA polymerase III subunit delta [Acetomicrobium hydrogeniformans]